MDSKSGEFQRRAREYESPRWGYRRGADGSVEKDIFDGDLPKGWVDSPARVDELPAHTGPVPKAEPITNAPAGSVETVPLAAPYADHGFHALRLELQRRTGKGPNIGTTKPGLIRMLDELDGKGTGA